MKLLLKKKKKEEGKESNIALEGHNYQNTTTPCKDKNRLNRCFPIEMTIFFYNKKSYVLN